jgi:ABC-type uncharacterized transport system permease subunit
VEVNLEAIEILFTASLWAAAIRIASPLIFGTLGELICERAGVLNLGIEGIMTAGAFAGWLTVFLGGDLWLAPCSGSCMASWSFPSASRSTSQALASHFSPHRSPTIFTA